MINYLIVKNALGLGTKVTLIKKCQLYKPLKYLFNYFSISFLSFGFECIVANH